MFENGFDLTLQQDFLDLVFVKHSTEYKGKKDLNVWVDLKRAGPQKHSLIRCHPEGWITFSSR